MLVVILTAYSPTALTSDIVLIYSLKSDVLCLALNILNTTSADVILEPSENFTSSLKLKIQVLGSVAVHFLANAGSIFISTAL